MKQSKDSETRPARRRQSPESRAARRSAADGAGRAPQLTLVAAGAEARLSNDGSGSAHGGGRSSAATRAFEHKLREAATLLRRGLPRSADRLRELFGDLAECAGRWAEAQGGRAAKEDGRASTPACVLRGRAVPRDPRPARGPDGTPRMGGVVRDPRPARMNATKAGAFMDATGMRLVLHRDPSDGAREGDEARTRVCFSALTPSEGAAAGERGAARRGEPLREWLLIPFGEVQVERPLSGAGTFVFTRGHAESAKRWFDTLGRKLAIDYEHQMFGEFNTRPDGLRPAAGWIGGLEVRDDGLWAVEVTWTPRAAEMLRSGEYRYFSPVIFWTDEDHNDVAALGPVALTNDPAMRGVAALAAGRAASGERRRAANGPSDEDARSDGAATRRARAGGQTLPCREGSGGSDATKPTVAGYDGETSMAGEDGIAGATGREDAETSEPVFPRVIRISEANPGATRMSETNPVAIRMSEANPESSSGVSDHANSTDGANTNDARAENALGDDEDDDDEVDGDDIAAGGSGSSRESGAEGDFAPNSAASSGTLGAEGGYALDSEASSAARRGSLAQAGAARDASSAARTASSAATTKKENFADSANSPVAGGAVSGEIVPEALLRELRTEVGTLRRQLAAQEADAFVERGMRAGKILDASSMDWRDDYLRDAAASESRLSRAPVVLPPGRIVTLDARGEPMGAEAGVGVAYGAATLRRGHGGPTLRRDAAPGGVEAEDLAAYERARVSGRIKEGVAGQGKGGA